MDKNQFERMRNGKGFIAALDQSGGSTPKALEAYGIGPDEYSGDEQMFDCVHAMRTRIITSPVFTREYILAVILFENTMDRTVEDEATSEYLWRRKGIVPFLKIDRGMEEKRDGVRLMKPIPGLDELLHRASGLDVFGTKMRSVIFEANPSGIESIVEQQFEVARQILRVGLVPIIEPEVDIHSPEKAECERILKENVRKQLATLERDDWVMFKFSIPSEDNDYRDLMDREHVLRIVALSGGYAREEAVRRLYHNNGLIASFSRALLENLNVKQFDEQFNAVLEESIKEIYAASVS